MTTYKRNTEYTVFTQRKKKKKKTMTTTSRHKQQELIRNMAHDFCQALITKPPNEILDKYMVSEPKITEHGPEWARERLPFLGKTFEGRKGCDRYFELLSDTLKMDLNEKSFPSLAGCSADAEAEARTGADELVSERAGIVSLVGKGRFTSLKTGKSWEEKFIYRLSGFDGDGKIGHWEIWADPLSAWVAVGDETSKGK